MASLSLLSKDEHERIEDANDLPPSSFVLHLDNSERPALDMLMPTLGQAGFIALVSTFRVHLGDQSAAATEAGVLKRLKNLSAVVVVFRVGNLLGKNSRISVWLRRLGFAYPLVPARMRSCFVTDAELAAAIETVQLAPASRRRVTLLGANRPWKDLLREHRTKGVGSACLTCVCYLLSFLLIGHVAALLIDLLARWRPSLRRWNFDTLRPESFEELLALYNPHNFRHVKVVGYNNGVVHFGHRHPGKTVVSTVLCNRIVRSGAEVIKADGGATIRKASDFLAADGRELYVLPNYSYVCLGTAFFVPIHGSAADYTTVAETITKALLYDPGSDQFVLATSDDPVFRNNVYNSASNMLVLRLWIRVKPKTQYFVQQQVLEHASSDELLQALRDAQATNVEIRKSKAGNTQVQLSKYYKAAEDTTAPVLEVPRDSLGRLWDRLEENAVTSFLMHALTRWFAWHVELFFTAEEFAIFWKTHQALPLKKIQLRYIRRDGLPHSPFCEHDCVSVDMFMFRWSRQKVEAYLKQTFAVIRSNPGKHSQ
jgi:hypothetical protein